MPLGSLWWCGSRGAQGVPFAGKCLPVAVKMGGDGIFGGGPQQAPIGREVAGLRAHWPFQPGAHAFRGGALGTLTQLVPPSLPQFNDHQPSPTTRGSCKRGPSRSPLTGNGLSSGKTNPLFFLVTDDREVAVGWGGGEGALPSYRAFFL